MAQCEAKYYLCGMYQRLVCVALRTIKYDDRRSIVTTWSDALGRISLIVPAGSSREARRRRALMMPLSVFEGEVDVRPGRELLSIRDVRPVHVSLSTAADPAKAVVAMFLSEVLERLLRPSQPDEELTAFLHESIEALDSMGTAVGVANFPVVFLYRLTHFLGITPDEGTWHEGRVLDLLDGVYRAGAPVHGRYLDAAESRVAAMLARLDYVNSARLRLPRTVRRTMLERLLSYYTLHHVSLQSLRSTHVVTEIF